MEKTELLKYIVDSLKEDFEKKSLKGVASVLLSLGLFVLISEISNESLGVTSTTSPKLSIIIPVSFILISILIYVLDSFHNAEQKRDKENQSAQNLTNQEVQLTTEIQKRKLYTLVAGIREQPTFDNVFQDFYIIRNEEKLVNYNPIYLMWADAYHNNYINASIINDNNSGENYLKISFLNNPGIYSWPGNIAIIHRERKPMATGQYPYLSFTAKVLDFDKEDEIIKNYNQCLYKEKDKSALEKIRISIRLVDKNLQHWRPGSTPNSAKVFKIELNQDWVECVVSINATSKWHRFQQDGNYLNDSKYPDFSLISLVFLEFGSYREDIEGLREGFGSIAIRDIRLKSEYQFSSNVQKI